jgi:hypothetical protein
VNFTKQSFSVLALVVVLASCSTASPVSDPLRAHVVVTADGTTGELFRGKATFGVRSAREGKADRVVSLPGLGEIQTGISGSETCRLVWSKNGLDALSLYEGEGCRAPEGGRMCFDRAVFTAASQSQSHSPSHDAPRQLVVDGCADENDLLWSKLEGTQRASVGPTSFRQRCRKLPRSKGCELTYVKKESLVVESNDSGDDGFALAFDGERWRACFLEKASGRYTIALTVEDSCGARGPMKLEGDSAELDD